MKDKSREEMIEDIQHMITLLLQLKAGLEANEKSTIVSSYMFRLVDILCDTELNLYNYFVDEGNSDSTEDITEEDVEENDG